VFESDFGAAMIKQTHAITRLIPPVDDVDFQDRVELLLHAVESGAAVNFLAPHSTPN
jgi:hypothetical protein